MSGRMQAGPPSEASARGSGASGEAFEAVLFRGLRPRTSARVGRGVAAAPRSTRALVRRGGERTGTSPRGGRIPRETLRSPSNGGGSAYLCAALAAGTGPERAASSGPSPQRCRFSSRRSPSGPRTPPKFESTRRRCPADRPGRRLVTGAAALRSRPRAVRTADRRPRRSIRFESRPAERLGESIGRSPRRADRRRHPIEVTRRRSGWLGRSLGFEDSRAGRPALASCSGASTAEDIGRSDRLSPPRGPTTLRGVGRAGRRRVCEQMDAPGTGDGERA